MPRWSWRSLVAACLLFGASSASPAQLWKMSGERSAVDGLAREIWASSPTVSLREALTTYPVTLCIDMGRMARENHRRHQVKPFLLAVLERPLSDAEAAEAKYELAQVCAQLQEDPVVRRLHGEILRDCPDFDRALAVGRRYAVLHDYAILGGLTPDRDKAIEILEWAVRRYPNCYGDTLACRVQLGNLFWTCNQWREAQAQFLAIYETPPASLRLPPEFQPNPLQREDQKLDIIQRRWERYRSKLVQKIVDTCETPPAFEGYEALAELIARYPGTEIEAAAVEKINAMRKREIDRLKLEIEMGIPF